MNETTTFHGLNLLSAQHSDSYSSCWNSFSLPYRLNSVLNENKFRAEKPKKSFENVRIFQLELKEFCQEECRKSPLELNEATKKERANRKEVGPEPSLFLG